MSKLSDMGVNIQAAALSDTLAGGKLKIYSGKMPRDANQKVSSQKLLVTVKFDDPAFSLPVAGKIESKPLEKGEAVETGEARWFRCETAKGKGIMDGTVGGEGSDADLVLSDTEIKKNAEITINNFVYWIHKAGG